MLLFCFRSLIAEHLPLIKSVKETQAQNVFIIAESRTRALSPLLKQITQLNPPCVGELRPDAGVIPHSIDENRRFDIRERFYRSRQINSVFE